MEKEKVVADRPFSFEGLTLVPIVRMSVNNLRSGSNCLCSCTKRPVAVVMVSKRGRQAFKANGDSVSMEELVSEFPGIEEILDKTICS